jgi:hypothetical protein
MPRMIDTAPHTAPMPCTGLYEYFARTFIAPPDAFRLRCQSGRRKGTGDHGGYPGEQ